MDIENFKLQYSALVQEMKKAMDEPENERWIIDDGVYDPEKYFSNEIRICWMLKEPYDEEEGRGGGWSYLSMFEGDDLYEKTFKFGHRTTWHPIIYTCYGVLNNFKKWAEIDFIRDNHEIAKIIREVAFVNAQKLPSKGVTRTNINDVIESIDKNGEFLKRQVKLLNPNVFIFANTFNVYKNMFGFNDINLIQSGSCSYFIRDNSIFINAYHPAQTQIKSDIYCNDIISAIQNWFDLTRD